MPLYKGSGANLPQMAQSAMGSATQAMAGQQKETTTVREEKTSFWDDLYKGARALDAGARAVNGIAGAVDKGAFMNGMEELVASSPIPYRLKQDGNGNFRELFRSDNDGGWVETGRTITPEQALEQMRGIMRGEKMVLRGADMKLTPENKAFYAAAFRSMRATELGNAENRLNPEKHIPLYDRNGNLGGVGIIQNRIDDYRGNPQLFAYGRNGNHIGVFDGFEGVMKYGLAPGYGSGGRKGKGRGSGLAGGGVSYGGRSGRRGASASANEAEATANGQKVYGVSSEDRKEFQTYATYTDDLGEKRIDSIKYDYCMRFKKKTGAPSSTIMAAIDANTERLMTASGGKLDRRQAERIVMREMWDRENKEQGQESAGQAEGRQGSQGAGQGAGGMAASQEKARNSGGEQDAGISGKGFEPKNPQDAKTRNRILEKAKEAQSKIADPESQKLREEKIEKKKTFEGLRWW